MGEIMISCEFDSPKGQGYGYLEENNPICPHQLHYDGWQQSVANKFSKKYIIIITFIWQTLQISLKY